VTEFAAAIRDLSRNKDQVSEGKCMMKVVAGGLPIHTNIKCTERNTAS